MAINCLLHKDFVELSSPSPCNMRALSAEAAKYIRRKHWLRRDQCCDFCSTTASSWRKTWERGTPGRPCAARCKHVEQPSLWGLWRQALPTSYAALGPPLTARTFLERSIPAFISGCCDVQVPSVRALNAHPLVTEQRLIALHWRHFAHIMQTRRVAI